MHHASEGLCLRRPPIPEPPDLMYRSNLHLALERYRALTVTGADRGQFVIKLDSSNRQEYPAASLDAAFVPAVAIASNVLGPKAFRPQRALNASVTDAILPEQLDVSRQDL